ncbi:zinc finger MYM-type protein 1 isoform X1 [Esox lucius]|uniref:zinc finger MYM-type protein 1 isoform X1 n=1 Tax=Esox lucius TaxID=8010 RepID=UPI001476B73B|nr:zinc finger MYM-type protein 1 isoform X1 [Esox lucius]
MKRKSADISSFSQKLNSNKPNETERSVVKTEEREHDEADSKSEIEFPSVSTGPSGPPGISQINGPQLEQQADSKITQEETLVSIGPSGPSDISKSRGDGPMQPHLKLFPRTLQGDRRRRFRALWYTVHSWLEYSHSQDSAYCYACRHFGPLISKSVFTSGLGYKNWKKATFRDGGFAAHAKSEAHTNAMIAWKEFEKEEQSKAPLISTLPIDHSMWTQENKHYIKTIADVLLLTATQNISLRTHRETMESDNRGNFLAILDLIGKHDPIVQKKLTGDHNSKYTSHEIQNEVLDTLAEMVRSSIIKEVQESKFFSILVDEMTDMKKKDQVSLVLRYYYNGAVKESFLHFEAAGCLNAAGLTEKITQILERYGLEYRTNLVGQAYDGASVMSGKHSGVQAHIKEVAKQAFCVHCNAHCLNLVLVDTVKAVPGAECFFSFLQAIHVFLLGSYVHSRWLNIQKEMYAGPPMELQRLSETRWACTHMAYHTIMNRLPAIVRVLQEIIDEKGGEISVEAWGLLAQIDLQFIGLLVTFAKVFGDTRGLSDLLQSPSLDLGSAVDLVEALVKGFQDYRDESYFKELWKEVLDIAEQCNVETEPAPKRKKKLSSKLDGLSVMSPLGERPDKSRDTFRTSIFYPILHNMLSEVNRRFSKLNCQIMKGIQALNPKSTTFCQEEVLFPFASIYECNIEDLKHEMHQMNRILERKMEAGLQKPSCIVDLTLFIEPYKEVFHELFRLCKIAVAIPVSTAACERSFSTLKLVKTYLRSTMDDDMLNNLGVLSVESRRAKSIDLDDFVDRFARNHNNRRIQLF